MATIPDWLGALGIVVPAASAVGGYFLAGLNDERRDARTATREDRAREALRIQQLSDERQAFQREVLLELGDAVQKLSRAEMLVIQHDFQTLRDGGQVTQMPEELNKQVFECGIRMLHLRERVLDADLRNRLNEYYAYAVGGLESEIYSRLAQPVEYQIAGLEQGRTTLMDFHVKATDRLGVVLREILGRQE